MVGMQPPVLTCDAELVPHLRSAEEENGLSFKQPRTRVICTTIIINQYFPEVMEPCNGTVNEVKHRMNSLVLLNYWLVNDTSTVIYQPLTK